MRIFEATQPDPTPPKFKPPTHATVEWWHLKNDAVVAALGRRSTALTLLCSH